MKSYYIQYLSEDQKQLLSKEISLEEIKDYDILMMHSEDYYEVKAKLDKERIKEILND